MLTNTGDRADQGRRTSNWRLRLQQACLAGGCLVLFTAVPSYSEERDGADKADKAGGAAKAAVKRPNPKALSAKVLKGLDWVIAQQHKNGGWSQGEESVQMGRGAALRDKPNVGDSCMAIMALLRSGSAPGKGKYKEAITKGLDFVCKEIAAAAGVTHQWAHIERFRRPRSLMCV